MRSGRTIFPGLKRPSGSKLRFTSPKASTMRLPSMGSRNSERMIPSPCSPECDPLYSRTSAWASSAMRRIFDTSSPLLRFKVGRTCRHPTEAWPYQTAVVSWRAKTSVSRSVYSASLSRGTAQSSMKATVFPSPFIDITMLSAALRTSHITRWSAGATAGRTASRNPRPAMTSSKRRNSRSWAS